MARQVTIKNYNDLSGCVVTDLNKLKGAPENAVKYSVNFEFSIDDGVSRRKGLDLESGISGSSYNQVDSTLTLGSSKVQSFTFKNVLDALTVPTHDIVFNTFDGKGIVYELGSDQQLADAVKDTSVVGSAIAGTGAWDDIAWAPELELAVAVSSSYIMISDDGVNWSQVAPGLTAPPQCIVWSSELSLFVVGCSSSTEVLTSPDGITWTEGWHGGAQMLDIAWSPELSLFVAITGASGAGGAYSSSDGYTWTSRTVPANCALKSVTWSAALSLFVAVGTGPTNFVATSPDGITWTSRTAAADSWSSVTWSPELALLVAVGAGVTNYVMTSTDGITWTNRTAAENNIWKDVIWVGGDLSLFIAVASTGTNRIMTSPDGTTWTARADPVSNQWAATAWSEELGKLIAVASTGTARVMTSTDGVTWASASSAASLSSNPHDWDVIHSIPIGAVGLPTLSVLYNTGATAYFLSSTLGLGDGPLIRDFAGIKEELRIDENPSVTTFTVTGITGTFTEGEDITLTSGASIRRYRIIDLRAADTWGVDKSLIQSDTTEFNGINDTDLNGYTIVGESSGATGTLSTNTGYGLSDAHRYNLINQGWTQTYMDTYAKSRDVWPNNTQVWYAGRDASNNFSPTELDKISFGNTPAPTGHILINPFREWRHTKVAGVWSGSVTTATYDRGFTTLAPFGSRVAMSGASINGLENTVYISPVIQSLVIPSDGAAISDLDFSSIFKFYQANDPTADIANELLPDDGVVIPITGAGRIYKVKEFHNALLVFASNGVWVIVGVDIQSGFTTDAFSVYKIEGASGTENVRSIVEGSSRLFYWADDGIYAIGLSQQGLFEAANITINRVSGLYSGIETPNKAAAISYYDEKAHKIYWAYNTAASATYPELRNGLLVLDLALNGFYPLTLPTTYADAGGDLSTRMVSINGFTQDLSYPNSDGSVPLKVIMGEHYTSAGAAAILHSVMEFNNSGQDFYDFVTYRSSVHSLSDLVTPEATYIDTWDDTLGDTSRNRQGIWVFVHMKKTETGWEDLGGGALSPVGASSLLMQPRWDWHDSATGGKWGTAREVYRHRRPYIPVDDTDTYDTGESIITTKNKIYGRGRALSLNFTAQDGKDAVLYGFAIPYSVEDAP